MDYVELLRIRNAARIYGSILVLLVAIAMAAALWGIQQGHEPGFSSDRVTVISISSDTGDAKTPVAKSISDLPFTIPIGFLAGIAAFAAIIFATILGPSMNKENDGAGFAFTKPVSRERLAIRYVLADLAAIIGCFAFSVTLMVAGIALIGLFGRLVIDPHAFEIAACGLGAAVMWYGLLQAFTSWHRLPGGLFIGLSWIAASVVGPIASAIDLGPAFHAAVMAVDHLNPLAYYGGVTTSGHLVTPRSSLGLGSLETIGLTWSIGIVACAVAALSWKRVEI